MNINVDLNLRKKRRKNMLLFIVNCVFVSDKVVKL